MPRRKTGSANGGQKSPGPKKSAKVNKITMQAALHYCPEANAATRGAAIDYARLIFVGVPRLCLTKQTTRARVSTATAQRSVSNPAT